MYQYPSHHQSKVFPIPKMVARSANYNAEIHEPPKGCQLVTIAAGMLPFEVMNVLAWILELRLYVRI